MEENNGVPLLSRGLLALSACCLGQVALAEDMPEPAAPTGIAWTCWHNGGSRVLCRLAAAPAAETAEAAALTAPYPGQSLLPPTVREIRERPMQLRGRTISIPTFSPPEHAANAEMLADAVMCGARPQCRVDFFRDVAGLAMHYEEDPALE